MKLQEIYLPRPDPHPLTDARQSFVVGSRGVEAIETCAEGAIVTLVPDGLDDDGKPKPAVRLLVTAMGTGVVE